MKNFFKIYIIYFLLFIFKEIKEFIIKKKSKHLTLKEYSRKNKLFNNYLKENNKFCKTLNLNDQPEKKILIADFVCVPAYTQSVSVIAKYVSWVSNFDLYGLVRDNDIRTPKIMESFGTKKIFKLRTGNLINKLYFFFESAKIIKNLNNVEDFLKFKYQNVNLGLIVYDHIIRSSRIGSLNSFNFKFIYFLAIALSVNKYCKNFFKQNKFQYAVISETQFIPNAIIFENALLEGCKVFAHEGESNKFSLRLYSSIQEKFNSKSKFSKKVHDLFCNEATMIYAKKGEKVILEKMKLNQKILNNQIDLKTNISLSKKEICDFYNWDQNKPIVGIFAHDFIDGNFVNSWRIFRDKLTWFKETVDYASKIDQVNWLIKEHPTDNTRKPVVTAKKIFEGLKFNKGNIVLASEKFTPIHLIHSLDLVLTVSGTVGLEFPCFGVPALIAGDAFYTGFGFTIEPKSKKEYFNKLKEIAINKKFLLTHEQKIKAQIYAFIVFDVGRVYCPLIPHYYWSRKKFNESKFWEDCMSLMKNYKFVEDNFYKLLKIQLKNNDTHLINYNYG